MSASSSPTVSVGIISLCNALEYRTTSRPSDEAMCLTSIMGLDVGKVVQVGGSSESRMRAFYTQLLEIPPTILFHRGERLQADGFRWAPLSFLSASRSKSTFYKP